MSYAVRNDGQGWRAISAPADVGDSEFYSSTQPADLSVMGAQIVTMRQARIALHRAGLIGQINDVIAALDEPARSVAQIEWEFAATVARNHPLIAVIAGAAEFSAEDIDDLFLVAAGL